VLDDSLNDSDDKDAAEDELGQDDDESGDLCCCWC
jgi:hypothetical protein